ncbi:MAG TPA: hypothetical protein VGI19_14280 [Candidatus Cybelea sp.]|jgi:hypothetical protein
MQYARSVSIASLVWLGACSGTGTLPAAAPSTIAPAISAPHRYKIGVFVRGNAKWYNPDPIVSQKGSVFVAYQNATQPTGTGGKSDIVEYDQSGHVVRFIGVKGRCDGMRWNPDTNLMWITVNEDANGSMFTWDPASGSVKHYAFSSAKHGGGYDDLAFANNTPFIAASNPKLDSHGINKGPAVVSVVLKGSTAEVTPVLMGDAEATDIPTGQKVRLNLTDPDSMTVAPNGDVLLVSQADEELVWIHDAGKSSQSVSRLLVGTELDDTVYATQSAGSLYVVDAKKNAVFLVQGRMHSGALYTEAPSDSGVHSFVGTVNPTTGAIKPDITGFGSPTGLIFVPT